MRSSLALALTWCLAVSAVPLCAGQPARGGPLTAAGVRKAARLAASGAPMSGAQPEQASAGRPVELQWGELAGVVVGRTVRLGVAGAWIEGQAMAVRDDALVVNVRKTSDSSMQPRGNAAIPRASVFELQVVGFRGSWGRKLGATIGMLTGLVAGAYITGKVADSPEVGIPLFLGLASSMYVGGYYAGRSVDRQVTVIRVASPEH